MADRSIVFAMANPTPEIDPSEAAKHAEVVATGEHLNDTRWEELLSELTELQVAVGGERRRLDDDRVAGENRGTNLAAGKVDREVPGHNAYDETQRRVALDGDLSVIFLNGFLLELELVEGS